MPAKARFAPTFACASPPRQCPSQARATAISRAETPPAFISSPASRKKGIAAKPKLSSPCTKPCASTRVGAFSGKASM
jgi:hypothetical protein